MSAFIPCIKAQSSALLAKITINKNKQAAKSRAFCAYTDSANIPSAK